MRNKISLQGRPRQLETRIDVDQWNAFRKRVESCLDGFNSKRRTHYYILVAAGVLLGLFAVCGIYFDRYFYFIPFGNWLIIIASIAIYCLLVYFFRKNQLSAGETVKTAIDAVCAETSAQYPELSFTCSGKLGFPFFNHNNSLKVEVQTRDLSPLNPAMAGQSAGGVQAFVMPPQQMMAQQQMIVQAPPNINPGMPMQVQTPTGMVMQVVVPSNLGPDRKFAVAYQAPAMGGAPNMGIMPAMNAPAPAPVAMNNFTPVQAPGQAAPMMPDEPAPAYTGGPGDELPAYGAGTDVPSNSYQTFK